MQIRNGELPGIDLSLSRREALGGLLAAILTPTLLAGTAVSQAKAQQPSAPTVHPVPRVNHTTTMLGDGTIMVAGGHYLGTLSDVRLFDMATDSWSITGSLIIPRTRHAAAMFGGQVLVCGGAYLGTMSDAEIYDPAAGTWSAVAPMNIPRAGHSAASTNGGVLVYGGDDLGPTAAPEYFNGSTWTLL